MQIQELEKHTGLERATIRYYEKEGLIKPLRLQNGYRDYSEKNYSDLLKIKLLRQIGLTLDQIAQIMRHEISLQSVLDDQLIVIENSQELLSQSARICKTMKQDSVDYDTVDPIKYLDMFHTPAIESCSQNAEIGFKENILREIHPVRRFLARKLDDIIWHTCILTIVIVILRIRPFTNIVSLVLAVSAALFTIPMNALLLWLFGRTPGKWAMGIKIESADGSRPSFAAMLKREWLVLKHGYGFYIPIYSLFKLLESYEIHKNGMELDWDYDNDAEVLYDSWHVKNEYIVAAVIAGIIALRVLNIYDSMLPVHRDSQLTVSQFAENYNDYAKELGYNSYLSEEGEWYRETSGVVIEVGAVTSDIFFACDANNYIESISMTFSASGKNTVQVITGQLLTTALTASVSHGMGYIESTEAAGRLEDKILASLSAGIYSDDMVLRDLNCQWNAAIEEKHEFSLSHIYLDEGSSYKLNVDIIYP